MAYESNDARNRSETYKEGGKVEAKREWQINPKPKSMKSKTKLQTFKGKEVQPKSMKSKTKPQTFKGKEVKRVPLGKAKKYEEGGKVKASKGTITPTGKYVIADMEVLEKDGKTKYKKTEAHQVNTPEGKRWYKGEGTSKSPGRASYKAKKRALAKSVSTPADSLVTGGKDPILAPKKKPKKKKFWQR